MEDEIDLRDIFRVLRKRRFLILGIFVVAVLAAAVISLAMPPVYKISSIIAVGNFEDPVYASQASMKNVMQSDEFLLGVLEELNRTPSEFEAFKDSVNVEPVKDSDRLVKISIDTEEKHEGMLAIEKMIEHYYILSEDSYKKQKKVLSDQLSVTRQSLDVISMEINQTRKGLQDLQNSSGSSAVPAELFSLRAIDLLNTKENQRFALMEKQMDLEKQIALITNMEVVQPAREPVVPIGPRKALIVAIAGMLGLMGGIFAAFLRESLGSLAE